MFMHVMFSFYDKITLQYLPKNRYIGISNVLDFKISPSYFVYNYS